MKVSRARLLSSRATCYPRFAYKPTIITTATTSQLRFSCRALPCQEEAKNKAMELAEAEVAAELKQARKLLGYKPSAGKGGKKGAGKAAGKGGKKK